MLLNAKPLLVIDLGFSDILLLLGVHIEDRLVDCTHLGLILLSKVHLRLLVGI